MVSLAPDEMRKERDAYRVMVVDDSAVIRGLIARWLDADPRITVVATAHNGLMALRNLKSSGAEVVILDVEMPEMDGMTALPKMIELVPNLQIIMASTLTRRNAEISLRALAAGAADYVPKPSTSREVNNSAEFRREIIEKVKALGAVARNLANPAVHEPAPVEPAKPLHPAADGAAVVRPVALAPLPAGAPRRGPIRLQKISSVLPRILAIGSSTGGPQALFELFKGLKAAPDLPVLITQHMPPTFTAILADHIARATGIPCKEAADGDVLKAGQIYIAPGDYHLKVEEQEGHVVARIDQAPPENFCRPAVDPMLRSVARVYGPATLAVILTGMGNDGMEGCQRVIQAGGTVLAQDEQSSVVWGMPGAVATAGLASAVLPLRDIAPMIQRLVRGGR